MYRLVSQQTDFELNAAWNRKPMKAVTDDMANPVELPNSEQKASGGLCLVTTGGTQSTDHILHPALFCAASSIFLHLYLYPAVHISFSRSLLQVFLSHPLPPWPLVSNVVPVWQYCPHFLLTYVQTSSIFTSSYLVPYRLLSPDQFLSFFVI